MKTFLTMLTTFACLAALPSTAAELVLRETATQHGPVVRLGDVADISAAAATNVRQLATTPLFPAPAPGTDFYLTVEKLRDLLSARGIDTSQLSITGSLVVKIGESHAKLATRSTSEASLPPEQNPLSESEIQTLIKQAIEQRLLDSNTTGRWRVEVPLTRLQLKQFAKLPASVTARELQTLRSGRIRFELSDGKQTWRLAANITQVRSVVVAKQAIERGQLVRAVDVEVREREGSLIGGALTDLQMAVGKVAQRNFKPDDVLQKSFLRAPWQVRRGETVNAFVRTGNIVVRSRAIAKQDGAMGDLITVETLENKQRLDVTVSGPSQVTVYATGGRATDYASLDRNETRRR